MFETALNHIATAEEKRDRRTADMKTKKIADYLLVGPFFFLLHPVSCLRLSLLLKGIKNLLQSALNIIGGIGSCVRLLLSRMSPIADLGAFERCSLRALTHHLLSSPPPPFVLSPSYPHHSALLLSLLLKSPVSGVTVPFCRVAVASFVLFHAATLSFSPLDPDNSPSRTLSPSPLSPFCLHPPPKPHNPPAPASPLLCLLLSGQLTYGSAFMSQAQGIPRDKSTPLTSPSSAADRR